MKLLVIPGLTHAFFFWISVSAAKQQIKNRIRCTLPSVCRWTEMESCDAHGIDLRRRNSKHAPASLGVVNVGNGQRMDDLLLDAFTFNDTNDRNRVCCILPLRQVRICRNRGGVDLATLCTIVTSKEAH